MPSMISRGWRDGLAPMPGEGQKIRYGRLQLAQ